MKNEMFTELFDSAHAAREHAQGKRNLRTTTLSRPPNPVAGRGVTEGRTSHATSARSSRQRSRKNDS